MLPKQRVAWVEGMLMEPQHFQQQERYLENYIHTRAKNLGAFNWGLSSLVIDEGFLEQGKFALSHGEGIFPDGSFFAFPSADLAPLPLELDDDCQNKIVCLALSLDMPGNGFMDFGGENKGSRYTVISNEVQDRNIVPGEETLPARAMIQLGQLQMRLCLRETASSAETLIPVAKLGERNSEGMISLNNKFLPPMLDFRAVGWLKGSLNEVLGLIAQRLSTVTRHDGHFSTGSLSETLEIMLVQTLAEYNLILSHLLNRPLVHPEALFQMLLGMLGKLSIIPGSESLKAGQELFYNHEQSDYGFFQLFAALRRALSLVIESPAVALPFVDRGDHVYLCQNDSQLRLEKLVFAVSAGMPVDQLRNSFPAQVKLGPVEKIVQLIDLQLPGARITAMGAPPRYIPYYPDSVYFEVDSSDALYKEMISGAAIAMSVVGDFPELRFDVWGLRQGRMR